MSRRWVCLDIGETLIDETRVWTTWAQVLGISRFTLLAAIGAAIARGQDHRAAFSLLGVHDWARREPEVQRAYGGFAAGDLYPDALEALAALRAAGYGVAVIGNQPARRTAELESLGVACDVMAMSEELGASKPDAAFFSAALARMGNPRAAQVAYVGDRVDNDVVPASACGMRAVWLRRGPWAALQQDTDSSAALVAGSLAELAQRIGEAWQ